MAITMKTPTNNALITTKAGIPTQTMNCNILNFQ